MKKKRIQSGNIFDQDNHICWCLQFLINVKWNVYKGKLILRIRCFFWHWSTFCSKISKGIKQLMQTSLNFCSSIATLSTHVEILWKSSSQLRSLIAELWSLIWQEICSILATRVDLRWSMDELQINPKSNEYINYIIRKATYEVGRWLATSVSSFFLLYVYF